MGCRRGERKTKITEDAENSFENQISTSDTGAACSKHREEGMLRFWRAHARETNPNS